MTWKYNYLALATSLILVEYEDLNEEFRFLNSANNGIAEIEENYNKLVDTAVFKGYNITEFTNIVDKGRSMLQNIMHGLQLDFGGIIILMS